MLASFYLQSLCQKLNLMRGRRYRFDPQAGHRVGAVTRTIDLPALPGIVYSQTGKFTAGIRIVRPTCASLQSGTAQMASVKQDVDDYEHKKRNAEQPSKDVFTHDYFS
ncbi:MAG: hypothetical protein ABI771_00310 [Betaproteobacteria bacterium]